MSLVLKRSWNYHIFEPQVISYYVGKNVPTNIQIKGRNKSSVFLIKVYANLFKLNVLVVEKYFSSKFLYIMVYRKMLYFHWTFSWVHQSMYTTGAVDIDHVI
jgi:hypothetical protein